MPKLGVVIASVREGRAGLPIAEWFIERARQHAGFEVVVIDLKQIDLPLFAERNHPRLQQYESEKQKAWSATVSGLDAFVFVTPEYNYGTPPSLLNALDYLYVEWNCKAAGFVSYGGNSGGGRGVQMAKQTLTTLKMVPLFESVTIPFFSQVMDRESGTFKGGDQYEKAATAMLNELQRWTAALAVLRS